jgi:long-chain acyl-CoA synthetase
VTGKVAQWSGYSWQTYGQIAARRLDFGRGLMYLHDELLGLNPQEKFHLGIYAQNRAEWVIADLGSQLFSNATVALYDTLGPETSEFILNHAEISIIVTSWDKVGNLFKLLPKCPKLKAIIVMEDNVPLLKSSPAGPIALYKQWGAEKGVKVFGFSEIEAFGKKHGIPPRLPKSEDLFCICYTSGMCLSSPTLSGSLFVCRLTYFVS